MSQSFEKPKKKPSKQDSLSKLNDDLTLARSCNDTKMIKIINVMIKRISELKDK